MMGDVVRMADYERRAHKPLPENDAVVIILPNAPLTITTHWPPADDTPFVFWNPPHEPA